jgi:hypothetical protein
VFFLPATPETLFENTPFWENTAGSIKPLHVGALGDVQEWLAGSGVRNVGSSEVYYNTGGNVPAAIDWQGVTRADLRGRWQLADANARWVAGPCLWGRECPSWCISAGGPRVFPADASWTSDLSDASFRRLGDLTRMGIRSGLWLPLPDCDGSSTQPSPVLSMDLMPGHAVASAPDIALGEWTATEIFDVTTVGFRSGSGRSLHLSRAAGRLDVDLDSASIRGAGGIALGDVDGDGTFRSGVRPAGRTERRLYSTSGVLFETVSAHGPRPRAEHDERAGGGVEAISTMSVTPGSGVFQLGAAEPRLPQTDHGSFGPPIRCGGHSEQDRAWRWVTSTVMADSTSWWEAPCTRTCPECSPRCGSGRRDHRDPGTSLSGLSMATFVLPIGARHNTAARTRRWYPAIGIPSAPAEWYPTGPRARMPQLALADVDGRRRLGW